MASLQELAEDPRLLFTAINGFRPFRYQEVILVDGRKRIIVKSARQIGKTTTIASKALAHAILNINALVLCIAPSERQSGHIYEKIRRGCMHKGIQPFIVRETAEVIEFANGSRIIMLPGSNPKTITGFSPTMLIIDEAAELKEATFMEILPSLRFTKGILILISTPHGKSGRFYKCWNDNDFSKHHIRSIDCPVNTPEEIEKDRLNMTDMEFQRYVMGEFVEAMDTYFARELVLSRAEEIKEETEAEGQHDYVLGVDCARYGLDETVYCVLKRNRAGLCQITMLRATSKKPLTDVMGRVQELHKVFNFRSIYIDSSGLGSGAVDVLIGRGLPIKNFTTAQTANKFADSVQFTLTNKEEMYKNLKLMMEQGTISYPHNEKLISQLSDLQYEFTESGHLKLHHPENGHDDFPDALALACLGGGRPAYKPVIR